MKTPPLASQKCSALVQFLACVLIACSVLQAHAQSGSSISILPLGDSLTWGYSLSGDTPGGYRDPLYSLLLGANINTTYLGVANGNPSTQLSNKGETASDGFNGYTISQIDQNLSANNQPTNNSVSNMGGFWLTGGATTPSPNIILLMAGTNDIALSNSSLTAQQIATQVTSNLQTLINDVHAADPKALLLVASPPPIILSTNLWSDTQQYNLDISNLISTDYQGQNIKYVDMYDNLDSLGYYVGEDGVHLNESGYTEMAQVWDSAIMADYDFTAPDAAPEPSTWALLLGGALALFAWRRLRRAK